MKKKLKKCYALGGSQVEKSMFSLARCWVALDFHITTMRSHHYEQCARLHHECCHALDEDRDKFFNYIKNGKNLHKLAAFNADEQLLGYVLFNKKTGYLSWLAVDPGQRGSGLGSSLLIQALQDGDKLGLPRLVLDVRTQNKRALSFYLKNDFDIIGCLLDPHGAMMVRMARRCPEG